MFGIPGYDKIEALLDKVEAENNLKKLIENN